MMNYLRILSLIFMSVGCLSAASTESSADQRKNPTMSQDLLSSDAQFNERISDLISNNVLRFAHALGQQLSLTNGEQVKSEIFSPLSLMSSLALLLLGARGKSYQELKQLFSLDSDTELLYNPQRFHEEFGNMLADLKLKDGLSERARHKVNWRLNNERRQKPQSVRNNKPFEHIIKVANGLFVQNKYNMNPTYRDVVENVYRAQFNQLDFDRRPIEARSFINSWVYSATNGKIPDIINDSFPRGTNVILASVLYFKGFWENSFIEAATTEDKFYPDGPHAAPKLVKMMATGGVFPYYDAVEHGCRIIGLPYRGNLTTMYVIQPDYPTRANLRQLQHYLDANKIEDMISKMSLKTAVLALPKMHFTRSINLKNLLMNMGIKDIFSAGKSDLSLIGEQIRYIGPTPDVVQNSAQRTSTLRQAPSAVMDRFDEAPLIFSRYSEAGIGGGSSRVKRSNTRAKYALNDLEKQRYDTNTIRSEILVEDILHKVDFVVNEQGTEAAAATLTYLRRSGTDVIFRAEGPFMILIRHDPTKLPLFYGTIMEPEL